MYGAFGHHVATNASGDVLIACRLQRILIEPCDAIDLVEPKADKEQTRDLFPAELLRLSPRGELVSVVRLRAARFLHAPAICLDDEGFAYVTGPFAPADRGLRGALVVAVTKLTRSGAIEWSTPLLDVPHLRDRLTPRVVRAAAVPSGGVCVTWIGRRRGLPIVRALRLTGEGVLIWEHTWPLREGEAFDPHVGVDASGAAFFWGTFRGEIAIDDVRVQSSREARYLARVDPQGLCSWACPVEAYPNTPYAMAVGLSGELVHAFVASSTRKLDAPRVLSVTHLDSQGARTSRAQVQTTKHTAISSLNIAPTSDGRFVIGGYFSGGLRVGGTLLQGIEPGSEAVFLIRATEGRDLGGCAIQGPQLQTGLSLHTGPDGRILLAGWLSGTMTLGAREVTSPKESPALFAACIAAP